MNIQMENAKATENKDISLKNKFRKKPTFFRPRTNPFTTTSIYVIERAQGYILSKSNVSNIFRFFRIFLGVLG